MLLELCRKDTQEKRVIFWMQMWFIVLINCYSIMQNLRFRRKKILRRLWTLLLIFLLNRSIFFKISLQYNWHVTLVSDAQHTDSKFVRIVSWLAQLLLLLLSRFSRVWPCATPQTAAHQAPLSLGFSRQEHWSGLPFPSPVHENEKSKWSHSVVSDS